MAIKLGAAANLRNLFAFAIVGIVATGVYLISTIGLAWAGSPPSVANMVGLGLSLLVSYLGHHRVTFSQTGQHGRFMTRFVASSAVLCGISTAWTWTATDLLGLTAAYSALVVAIGYPPMSYLMNALWTFRESG